MSFKREGNDASLLQNLRKRRINELFADDIPDDEAKLLCNGRFACLVCSHNPIFDTVAMLSVHRKGKKHAASLEIHEGKKMELRQLIAQRKHEQFLKTGTTDITIGSNACGDSSLLSSSPYNPCVKKTKLKSNEMKPKVDLLGDGVISGSSLPKSDRRLEAWDNSSCWSEIAHQQLSGPVIHDCQLKKIPQAMSSTALGSQTNFEEDKLLTIQPYKSKQDNRKESAFNPNKSLLSSGKTESIPSFKIRLGSPEVYQTNFDKSVAVQKSMSVNVTSISSSSSNFSTSSHLRLSSATEALSESKHLVKSFGTLNGAKSSASRQTKKPLPPQTRPTLDPVSQKLKLLQGSGWKRDWDGKWIKDEEAEFDSDEEPPDIP